MNRTRNFDGKIVLVTGAASGIGRAIAERFAEAGASVVIADRDAVTGTAVAEAIVAGGGSALALACDIADPGSIDVLVSAIEAEYGLLDILVNNAGVVDTTGFNQLTLNHYSTIMRINLDGALMVTMRAIELLRSSEAGRIVNVASIMGTRGSVGALAYSTAKGGMVNLTRALACDLAPDGILVNAVAPGFIDTPMCIAADGSHEFDADWFRDIYITNRRIPLARAGQPDDVAGPVLFLCSDDARYITGQILMIDGGVSASF